MLIKRMVDSYTKGTSEHRNLLGVKRTLLIDKTVNSQKRHSNPKHVFSKQLSFIIQKAKTSRTQMSN